jgi:hypothetical protein
MLGGGNMLYFMYLSVLWAQKRTRDEDRLHEKRLKLRATDIYTSLCCRVGFRYFVVQCTVAIPLKSITSQSLQVKRWVKYLQPSDFISLHSSRNTSFISSFEVGTFSNLVILCIIHLHTFSIGLRSGKDGGQSNPLIPRFNRNFYRQRASPWFWTVRESSTPYQAVARAQQVTRGENHPFWRVWEEKGDEWLKI